MHNLFGDRYLRLFAGDLQRREKRSISNDKDQNPEAKADDPSDPINTDLVEGHEKSLAKSDELQIENESKKKNDN